MMDTNTTPFDHISDAAILSRWEALSLDERADVLRLVALAAVEAGRPDPVPGSLSTNRMFLEMLGLIRATYALTPEGEEMLREGRERWRAKVMRKGGER